MAELRRRLAGLPATLLRWSVRLLAPVGWALAPALPLPPFALLVHQLPDPAGAGPSPAPVLPPGHPDRFDPSPPTDVERELWIAAQTGP
ncbi:hypothetical protein [Symbioplanes lichenis]|uniref:hypothetical protein n=1 Tax=Symbioplanes lichenis TaxID=1629072 RepID=UPI002738C653|nr:hypothetical protein [Actinoplanes lichenis]